MGLKELDANIHKHKAEYGLFKKNITASEFGLKFGLAAGGLSYFASGTSPETGKFLIYAAVATEIILAANYGMLRFQANNKKKELSDMVRNQLKNIERTSAFIVERLGEYEQDRLAEVMKYASSLYDDSKVIDVEDKVIDDILANFK